MQQPHADAALLAVAELLQRSRQLLVLTGAGCSTECGIPDYRDTQGAWKRKPPMSYQEFIGSFAARQRYWARASIGWRLFGSVQPGKSHRVLARQNLKIAVVGDIDAETLKPLLDRVFAALPEKPDLAPIENVTLQGLGRRIDVSLDVPQSVVDFGGPGVARQDPDFMAAYIVNHILGGGTFSSRLYQEVREKRGLVYGVSDSLLWLDHAALFIGGTATRADRTDETVDLVGKEIHRLAEEGPTAEELAEAKNYLNSSFALNLDTSTKIASFLVQLQLDHLGTDYIERRPAMIGAVTLDDARRMAKRLLDNGLLVTVVGKPKGVASTTAN